MTPLEGIGLGHGHTGQETTSSLPYHLSLRFLQHNRGAYERHLNEEQHTIGKRYTQKIEPKHLNYRTRIKRLARKTICFSKSELMHDTVIGLFINRFEFGLTL